MPVISAAGRRMKTAIEYLLNLTNAGHVLMKILLYESKWLSAYQGKSPQELRHALEPADTQGSIFRHFGIQSSK